MTPTPSPKPLTLAMTLLLVVMATATQAKQTLYFECLLPPESPYFSQLKEIHRQVFEPLDYQIEFVPSKIRSGGFQQLIRGELDGSCGRTGNVFSSRPEYREAVFSLDTPIYNYSIIVLSDKKLSHAQLQQARLGASPITQTFHPKLKTMGLNLIAYKNESELLKAIEDKAVDGIIAFSSFVGFNPSLHPQFQQLHTQHLILSSIKLALHKKHQKLQPLVQKSLYIWYQKNKKRLLTDAQTAAETLQNSFNNSPGFNRRKITFSCGTKKWDPAFNQGLQLYGNAFQTLGYDFEMVSVPKSREQTMLASRQVDGSCGLTSATNQVSREQMIPVDFLLLTHQIDLWSSQLQPMLQHHNDIPAAATVSYTRSLMVLEDIINSLPQITPVGSLNVEQMIRITAAGRADYGLGVDNFIHNYRKINMLNKDMYLIMRSGPYNFYPYLTPDNQELAAPLSKALKEGLPDY